MLTSQNGYRRTYVDVAQVVAVLERQISFDRVLDERGAGGSYAAAVASRVSVL